MALTHDDVREILEIIDSSGPSEIQVQTEGFSLHVLIGDTVAGAARPAAPPPPAPPRATAAPATAAPATAGPAAATPPAAQESPAPAGETDHLATIESPMLGTFYRAESPGAEPFVEIGSVVEADTTVCIIEVMKMMNSVSAGVAGRIVEICPANAQLVEFGEPLFRVEPA